jgi:D-alanyl-D-alanine carboxypeptidase (penicillin-binding protein 5/6)
MGTVGVRARRLTCVWLLALLLAGLWLAGAPGLVAARGRGRGAVRGRGRGERIALTAALGSSDAGSERGGRDGGSERGRGDGGRGQRPPWLSVTGACLFAPATDQVLYGVRGDAELPIASTTKLMTALITLKRIHDLSRVFTQIDWIPAPDDSQIGLWPGERMTVRNLLTALLLPSADDAAVDLAAGVGRGSVERFIAMMNAEARTLGLHRTHYSTPSGLDTPGNHSSPCDLDRLAAYDLSQSSFFRRTVDESTAVISAVGGPRFRIFNTDDLLGRVPWIHGIKTGHTAAAGYVLVSLGERGGLELIGSVLGTDSEAARDANALRLLDYGFAAFREVTPLRRGEVVAHRPVAGSTRSIALVAGAGWRRVLPSWAAVRVVAHVPSTLTGPLPRGAAVGRAWIEVGGRRAASVPLLAGAAVPGPVHTAPGPVHTAPTMRSARFRGDPLRSLG